MKRIFQQLFAAWLVVSFALAGAVGISPLLHQWVEHGGRGPAHTHRGAPAIPAHPHDRGHAHPHAHSHASSHRHDAAPTAPEEPASDHEHGSLSQLLASGLVDLSVATVFDPVGTTQIVARVQLPPEFPQVRNVDLLRAGRGPPFSFG